MSTRKKIMALSLSTLLMLTGTACGGDDGEAPQGGGAEEHHEGE